MKAFSDKSGAVFKAVLALLLVGSVLFTSLTASNPALHKLIHDDAAAADHTCVITLFTAGHVCAAIVDAAVAAILWIAFVYVFPALSESISRVSFNFSSSRAPPAQVCL